MDLPSTRQPFRNDKYSVLLRTTSIAEYILTAEQRHRLFSNQLMELAREKWRSTTEEIIRIVMILEDSTREFGGVNSVRSRFSRRSSISPVHI